MFTSSAAPTLVALFALVLAAAPTAPAAAQTGDSYPFLRKQAQLEADYERWDAAAASWDRACGTPEGSADSTCWESLALASERAGLIGVAVAAWDRAAATGSETAGGERARIVGTWAPVRFQLPPGRDLPSVPGELSFEGLLLDPRWKAVVANRQQGFAADGLPALELWLPAGTWRWAGLEWEMQAGQETAVAVPARLLSWLPPGFALGGARPALAGPSELTLQVGLRGGGLPSDNPGLGPIAGAARLRLSRQVGPVHLGTALRYSLTPVASRSNPGRDERAGLAHELGGDLEFGLVLVAHRRLLLVPLAFGTATSLGPVLSRCVALAADGAAAWRGECRLPTWGGGGGFGLEAALVPGRGRFVLRAGLRAEALVLGVATPSGKALGGAGPAARLVRVDARRLALLRGGVDVGVGVRF